jgi:hypothetical protein
MVRGHTYFLARKGVCEGVFKDREALAKALADLYDAHKGDAERTVMDGASAWLDEASALHLRVIAGGVARAIAPSEAERESFSALMTDGAAQ